jgi:hypothetical protein
MAHKSAKQRGPGERVYVEPKTGLKLLKPGSECSTPEMAAEMSQEVMSALRKLGRKRKTDAGDDSRELRKKGGEGV